MGRTPDSSDFDVWFDSGDIDYPVTPGTPVEFAFVDDPGQD